VRPPFATIYWVKDGAKVEQLQRLDNTEGVRYELFHRHVAIRGNGPADTIGDDGAEAQTMVSQKPSQSIDAGCLHLEVGDPVRAIGEACQSVDELGLVEAQAKDPSLGTVEAGAGDGDALVEAVHKVFEEGRAGRTDIGMGQAVVQLGLSRKGLQEGAVLIRGIIPVKIQQVVDTQAMGAGHKAVDRNIFLQAAGSAHADDGKGGGLGFDHPGGEVDIGQGVQLIENDVYIVGADAGGDDGDPFLSYVACVGNEFAVLGLVFDGVEMTADSGYPIGVAYGEDGGGQLFGTEVQVVDGAAAIDNEFTFSDCLHKFGCFFSTSSKLS